MELEDGTSEFTVDIASNLYHNYGVNSLAHLTCVSSTKEQVHCVVERLKEEGLENILALRGDLPKDRTALENAEYQYASELIYDLKQLGDFLYWRSLLSRGTYRVCE